MDPSDLLSDKKIHRFGLELDRASLDRLGEALDRITAAEMEAARSSVHHVIGFGQFEKAPEWVSAIVPHYDRPRRMRNAKSCGKTPPPEQP